MKKTYFLLPLILTIIFGVGFVMHRQAAAAAEEQHRLEGIAARDAAKKAREEEQKKAREESTRQLAELQVVKKAKEKLIQDRKDELVALETELRTAEAERKDSIKRREDAQTELAAETALQVKSAEQLRQLQEEGTHLRAYAERITANDRRLTELMERLAQPAPAPAPVTPPAPATPAVASNR